MRSLSILRRAVMCALLLGLIPLTSAAQTLDRIGSGSSVVVAPEWAGLVFARAAEAVHAGDVSALNEALTAIAKLGGEGIDAPLISRSLPVPAGLTPDQTEVFVLNEILPYLHPAAAGQSITCGGVTTLTFSTQDAGGIVTEDRQARLPCTAGSVEFAYVGNRITSRGGPTIEIQAYVFGDVPVAVMVRPDGGLTIAPQTDAGTLLAMAAELGHANVVQRLLDAGAAVDARGPSGRTALMVAAESPHFETLRTLIDGGASLNLPTPAGLTPLLLAATAGLTLNVDLLLERGADANAKDGSGRNAIHLVVSPDGSGSTTIIDRLVAAGTQVDRPSTEGHRPLHLALTNQHVDAARALLGHGADAATRDGAGRTPLGLAIDASVPLLEELVAAGGDLEALEANGRNALHVAALTGEPEMVREVLRLGGEVETLTGDGATALILAAENDQVRAVDVLLAAGAEFNVTDPSGNTALHRAARAGKGGPTEQLLRAGASRGARNADGRSPQDLAGEGGHGNVQSIFRHTKLIHLSLLKGSVGFTALSDPQHESSVGWDFSLGLGLKVHERLRLQTEVAWATRTTDPTEEGPVMFPNGGDFYYATYSVDIRPSARLALGNPYRTHLYLVGGVSLSTIEEVEILDWVDPDADGTTVTDQSDLKMTSPFAGLGVQGTLGRTITSFELVLSRGSEVRLDRFMGSMGSVMMALSFAW